MLRSSDAFAGVFTNCRGSCVQACATCVRVLMDYLPRNKLLSYRAVTMEVEARTNLAARHYQTLVKTRRAKAVLAADPANEAAKVRALR